MGQEDITRQPLVREAVLAELLTPAPGPSILRPTWVRYRVLFVACTVAVVIYIHRVGFARALPEIETDLDLSPWQSSWVMAVFLIAYAGFEIPWGLRGDRLGTRYLLTVLILGWSLLTGLASLAVMLPARWALPFIFLLAVRFGFGAFQAGAFPSLSRMMTDWMTVRQRGTAQGLIWMSTRVGGTSAGWIITGLMALLGGWQGALWAVAAVGGLWAIFFWLWFRDRPELMPGVNTAERELISAGRPPSARHSDVPWGRMLRSRNVWALCLLYMFGGFAANFYVTLLPRYLRKEVHLSDDATTWVASVPIACGAVSCLLGGLLSDWIIRRTGNRKWGRRLNGTVGMLIGAGCWLALGQAQEAWMLGVLLSVLFFCNDLGMGPVWASVADVGERHAGTLGGTMNMMGNLAGALGAIIAGYFFGKEFVLRVAGPDGDVTEYVAHGSQLLFLIYAVSFALASLSWQGVDVTKPVVESD